MPHQFVRRIILTCTALVCVIGCITDLVLLYTFGKQIPGYSQLTNSISSLGVTASPVSEAVMLWSVALGIIFIVFGFGFREIFKNHGRVTQHIFWLILIYGIGEGIASGVFKDDYINGALTKIAIVHDLLGGVGVVALLLLPLSVMKIFTYELSPGIFRLSQIVLAVGLISTILFSFRIDYFENTFLNTYSGIWQRTFLVNYYVYFTSIAFQMVKENNSKQIRKDSTA
ncbi:MAG: DUF998 domain-containing protein [Bacteroidales bacterium]